MFSAPMIYEDRDKTLDDELATVRARFKSLPADVQQDYQERARMILPPSYHNDLDIVMLNALQLFLRESTWKGTKA